MSTEESSNHIFISHSSLDALAVENVRKWLIEIGLDPWVSYNDIKDREFQKNISRKLASCKIFLLVLSQNSIKSEHVLSEIHLARHKHRKKIFVYTIEHVTAPEGVDLDLARIHEIRSFEHPDDSLERLAKQLLKETGISDSEALTIIKRANLALKEHREEEELKHQLKLQEWRDSYWNRKWRNGRVVKELARLDRDTLDEIARELGLTKGETDLASKGKRDRKAFNHSLDSLLKRHEISRYDIYVVEKRRIQFQVSQKEVRELVARRQSLPIIKEAGGRNVPAYPVIEWLEVLLKLRRKHLEEINQSKTESRSASDIEIGKELHSTEKTNSSNSNMPLYQQNKYALTEAEESGSSKRNNLADEGSDQVQIEHSGSMRKQKEQIGKCAFKHYPEKLHKAIRYLAREIGRSADNISDLVNSEYALRSLSLSLGLTTREAEDCILLVEAPHATCTIKYLLISCRYVLIKFIDPWRTTVRYPLIAAAPMRRLTISHLNKSEELAIGYTKRHGTLEHCISFPCDSDFIGVSKIKFIELLLVLLESNDTCFSEVANMPSHFLNKTIDNILNLRFHELLTHASKQHGDIHEKASKPIQKNTSTAFLPAKKHDNSPNDNQSIANNSSDSFVAVGGLLEARDTYSMDSAISTMLVSWPWLSLHRDCANESYQKDIGFLQNEQQKYISQISEMHVRCNNLEMPIRLKKLKRIQSGADIGNSTILHQLLKAHCLDDLKGFKPLLYYNAGDLRVKRGFIIFDKGISLLSYFTTPRLFLFDAPNGGIEFKIKAPAKSELEISVEGPVYGINKVAKATYIFHGLDRNSTALFASSLRKIIEDLIKYRSLYSKLKDSIWAEAHELHCFKMPDRGSGIGIYDSSVKSSRLLTSDLEMALKTTRITMPSPLDTILAIKVGGASFGSLIVICLEGITLLSSCKDAARGRSLPWHSVHSFTYLSQYGSRDSAFVVTSGRGSFALRCSNSSESDDQCRELAAFIASLAKRFRHLP